MWPQDYMLAWDRPPWHAADVVQMFLQPGVVDSISQVSSLSAPGRPTNVLLYTALMDCVSMVMLAQL